MVVVVGMVVMVYLLWGTIRPHRRLWGVVLAMFHPIFSARLVVTTAATTVGMARKEPRKLLVQPHLQHLVEPGPAVCDDVHQKRRGSVHGATVAATAPLAVVFRC